MRPELRQVISAVSILYTTFAVGLVLAFPGMILEQWKTSDQTWLSDRDISWFASISQLMAIPGSLLGGYLVEKIGSRQVILTGLPAFGILWIATIQSVFISPTFMIFMRGMQGLLGALLSIPAFVYPCEIAEPKRRGFLGTLLSCMYSLSFLLTYIAGGVFHWQTFSYLCIGITIIPCFIGAYFAVESPIWLARKGRLSEAKCNLLLIRTPSEDLNVEIKALEQIQPLRFITFSRLIRNLQFRSFIPLIISVSFITLRELSGPFVISVFPVQIFQELGSTVSPYWQSIVVGLIRLICNAFCSSFLDKIRRKLMIALSCLQASLSLLFLALYYYNRNELLSYPALNYVPLVCLILIVICFAVGIDPVTALISSEIQPSETRCFGAGIVQASFSLSSWLCTYIFMLIKQNFGLQFCFLIFAVGCIITSVFIQLAVPETKGKTLSQIEEHWMQVQIKWQWLKNKVCC